MIRNLESRPIDAGRLGSLERRSRGAFQTRGKEIIEQMEANLGEVQEKRDKLSEVMNALAMLKATRDVEDGRERELSDAEKMLATRVEEIEAGILKVSDQDIRSWQDRLDQVTDLIKELTVEEKGELEELQASKSLNKYLDQLHPLTVNYDSSTPAEYLQGAQDDYDKLRDILDKYNSTESSKDQTNIFQDYIETKNRINQRRGVAGKPSDYGYLRRSERLNYDVGKASEAIVHNHDLANTMETDGKYPEIEAEVRLRGRELGIEIRALDAFKKKIANPDKGLLDQEKVLLDKFRVLFDDSSKIYEEERKKYRY